MLGEEGEEEEEQQHRSWCKQGHRPSLSLQTSQGGTICLLCFTNLLTNPNSLSLHVSYALSQLSQAIRQPLFLQTLKTFHSNLLISPLAHSLSAFDDDPLARQTVDLIALLCDSDAPGGGVLSGFVAQVAGRLSSGSLAWSRRQIYTLHCFGVLLNRQIDDLSTYIKDKGGLISNLVNGLQLPSGEIQGEILFVLYKLAILDGECDEDFFSYSPKLLHLSLEALLKTQDDDVRLNCIALLTVLAQRGYMEKSFANDQLNGHSSREAENFTHSTELVPGTPLIILFADAIKGPLLSSNTHVQISALDLIFHSLSSENLVKQIQALVEENVADYVFEILRLSENKDPLVVSCLRVLALLATDDQAFRQRLAVGFPTLVSVLRYVAEIPLHPVQSHTLKLVWSCIFNFPGIISRSQIEELVLILTEMFRRHTGGEIGMLSETFTMACLTFVALLKSPSSHGIPTVVLKFQEALQSAVIPSLCAPCRNTDQYFLYSLYFLKEAYEYSREDNCNMDSDKMELANCIIEICETQILPWLGKVIEEGVEEEIVLGIFETFHSILLQGSDAQTRKFAEMLASSSWFSMSIGCLGLFPSDQMKWRVYMMLSLVIGRVLGHDAGQPIRDAALYLPSDPLDLLFLLGQRSSHDPDLICSQSAVLLILHTSSLYDDRLADENQTLASLEQYILVNSNNFLCGIAHSGMLTQLMHLYGLIRSAMMSNRTPYSPEAERLLFHLIVEGEWDLLSTRIHPMALKWLFQQDKIVGPLSNQILNLCRLNSTKMTQISNLESNNQTLHTKVVAELVVSGDNCVTSLLVSLLRQFQEEEAQEDIPSVMNLITDILNIFPSASDQFCQHGISDTIRSLYYSIYSSPGIFTTSLLLVFNILRSARPENLLHDEAWLPATMKLLEFFIPALGFDACNQEGHLVMSILCLILHHSTNQTLMEASKAILLNTSLVPSVNNIIQAACAKGPALVDHDEETSTGETLIFMLLMYFFSLRSLNALLQETLDWQDFLQSSNDTQSLSVICIRCHDLCRLIHFGSSSIKLIASQCLLELLTRISEQRNSKHDELNCSVQYLESVMAILEHLIFFGDTRVAMNCGLCLSMILGWEKLGMQEKRAIKDDKWCRVIVEELALSLAAPGLASKSFMNQHKPAAHIAIALLRLEKEPQWMRSVFDGSCISGIIENLSASNVSAEMVQLFRELGNCGYLNTDQITGLHCVFQVCRKHMYMDSSQDNYRDEHFEKVLAIPDDLGKICRLLIDLMSSPRGDQNEDTRLLEQIEMFFQECSAREK